MSYSEHDIQARKPVKILVADSSVLLCELIKYNLQKEGYDVTVFLDSESMLAAEKSGYSLLLIDESMLGSNGGEVVRNFRYHGDTSNVAVVLLTTPERCDNTIDTLDFGVDDFLVKPFSMRVMTARINAILRRSKMEAIRRNPTIFRHDDLRLDIDNMTASINDSAIDLNAKQCELLAFLMLHRNTLYTESELTSNIWPDLKESVNIKFLTDDIKRKIGRYAIYLFSGPTYGYIYAD